MNDPLEFQQFIEATLSILEEDGFDSYLPTLYVEDEIVVIEGIPESVSDTDALNNIGPEHGLGIPGTFFAVLVSSDSVIAGEASAAGWNFAEIKFGKSALVVVPAARPDWFRL